DFSVMRPRGQFIPSSLAARVMATVHPSSILRALDEPSRHEQKEAFIRDLAIVAHEMRRVPHAASVSAKSRYGLQCLMHCCTCFSGWRLIPFAFTLNSAGGNCASGIQSWITAGGRGGT